MPFGPGRGGGRGRGSGKGARGMGHRGAGRAFGIGRPENCICPACGVTVPHQQGFPCFQMRCPRCGNPMTRRFVITDTTVSTARAKIPQIDLELCTGCGKCVAVCPVDAIKIVDQKAVINEQLCNGCRVCVTACPVNAIK